MADGPEALGARWQAERCPECGFDPADFGPGELPAAVTVAADAMARLLDSPAERLLRARPSPVVWSPLAYACHVRDVHAVFTARIERMLAEDDPDLGWWDHEAAVEQDGYERQEPVEVAVQLRTHARALAAALAAVPSYSWERSGTRRGSERFTVLGAGRFALHETVHHCLDVERILHGQA